MPQWRFEAIGTEWTIDTANPIGETERAAISAVISAYDRAWSRFRPDSTVCALAAGTTERAELIDAELLLRTYAELSDATAGAVNPLVGASLAARGYDAELTMRDRGAAPAPDRWRDQLCWQGDAVRLTEPATIDIGAIGKGALVDRIANLLRGSAVTVDGSGDIVVRGRAERIGLEHPYDPQRAIGVWQVADAALCASATNRRQWGDGLHHVLDARTGEPVVAYAATWAVADSAMIADAIATALFFEGGPAIARRWGVSWVRMRTDGGVQWSPGCRAELFRGD